MSETKECVKELETLNENPEVKNETEKPEDNYLIRDCDLYWEEYKECTSFRGRFHQYFIYGHALDCNQWRKDYDNCCKWTNNEDLKAAHPHGRVIAIDTDALISSEKARRLERFRAHYRNNIWKKRESPPADWDKPLPEWLAKRDENTYLAQKAKELREGKEQEDSSSFCCIM